MVVGCCVGQFTVENNGGKTGVRTAFQDECEVDSACGLAARGGRTGGAAEGSGRGGSSADGSIRSSYSSSGSGCIGTGRCISYDCWCDGDIDGDVIFNVDGRLRE